jgi:hypothetical protein
VWISRLDRLPLRPADRSAKRRAAAPPALPRPWGRGDGPSAKAIEHRRQQAQGKPGSRVVVWRRSHRPPPHRRAVPRAAGVSRRRPVVRGEPVVLCGPSLPGDRPRQRATVRAPAGYQHADTDQHAGAADQHADTNEHPDTDALVQQPPLLPGARPGATCRGTIGPAPGGAVRAAKAAPLTSGRLGVCRLAGSNYPGRSYECR